MPTRHSRSQAVLQKSAKAPQPIAQATLAESLRLIVRELEALRDAFEATFGDPIPVRLVAKRLRCSEQAIRSIGSDLLPRRRGPGKELLVTQADIARFRDSLGVRMSPALDEILREIEGSQVGSRLDSGRRGVMRGRRNDRRS